MTGIRGRIGAPTDSIAFVGTVQTSRCLHANPLTLDPDVAAKAKAGAAKLGRPCMEVVNAALRIGLEQVHRPPASKPYCTHPRPLGLRRGFNYGNIGELLARAEGEDYQ